MCACVCACVCKREGERERERDGERDSVCICHVLTDNEKFINPKHSKETGQQSRNYWSNVNYLREAITVQFVTLCLTELLPVDRKLLSWLCIVCLYLQIELFEMCEDRATTFCDITGNGQRDRDRGRKTE